MGELARFTVHAGPNETFLLLAQNRAAQDIVATVADHNPISILAILAPEDTSDAQAMSEDEFSRRLAAGLQAGMTAFMRAFLDAPIDADSEILPESNT